MNDFKIAIRQLLKDRGFTSIAIASLALGLAVTASTLAVVNAYLFRSMPYPDADRLYHLRYAPPGPYEPGGMSALDWKKLEDVVEDAVTSSGGGGFLRDGGHPHALSGRRVSSGFIRGLGVRAILGRTIGEEDIQSGTDDVVMIGHALWRDRFGADPNMIGRTFELYQGEEGESETVRVVGVLPPGFWFGRDSEAHIDILRPLRERVRTYMVRLREGVLVAYAEQRITEEARNIGHSFRPGWAGVHLVSLHDRYVENIRPVLVGIMIAVGMLLLLVCSNVAVLMLLRTLRRQKEMAVCAALGAERKHMARMLLAEACLVCGTALVLGLAMTGSVLRLLGPRIETHLGRPAPAGASTIGIDSGVLLAVAGMGVLIAVSLSFLPLLAPWQRRLADVLRTQGTSRTDGPLMVRIRSSLIVLEIAGSLILLVACGLMIRSAVNQMRTDLGFNPEGVIRVGIRLPNRNYSDAPAQHRFYTAFLQAFANEPSSPVVLNASYPPFYEHQKQPIEAEGGKTDEPPVGVLRVGAGYFALLGATLKQGREFTTADQWGSEPVVVISETLARRLWPNGNALGRQIRTGEPDVNDSPLGEWMTVVGVVGDIRQGYDDTELSDVYFPYLQKPTRFASVYVRTTGPPSLWLERVRTAAHEIEPYATVDSVSTISSEDRQGAGTRFLTAMLTGFAGFALFLALLGIYGVTTYAAQQREREIAIRMAVGADRPAIVGMFLKEAGRLLACGVMLGLLGTIGTAKILEHQVFGVKPFDFPTVAATSALLIAAGLLAGWWPARRASAKNPMSVLKEG